MTSQHEGKPERGQAGRLKVDLSMQEMGAILERSRPLLPQEDFAMIEAIVATLQALTQELEKKDVSVQRLQRMLFGSCTEKTAQVLEQLHHNAAPTRGDSAPAAGTPTAAAEPAAKDPPKGHGRNGADAYAGARKIQASLEKLQAGDPCPICRQGKVYTCPPGLIVRLTGQAPVGATVYELAKLRCGLCGEIFTAPAPAQIGPEKYDAASAAMIGLLKYGAGVPFHRLENLQESLGLPLPAATQWEIVEASAQHLAPALGQLIHQAAQGEVLHNDDTTMKILARAAPEPAGETPVGKAAEQTRRGVFTSGIVSQIGDHRIALFFTGRRHAGENLVDLLRQRDSALGPPIQMCDALSRNMPAELRTLLAHCLAHGRRKFVDVAASFPDECLHVLEILKDVYKNDAAARDQAMGPEERLRYHQAQSAPRMAELQAWMDTQITQRKVEPNSGLGEAIAYMRKHWDKLTLFLRVAGAPLDNNICERALKKAILHRKNAYFFKTQNGARVGDLFMSLIHTCQLNAANPFDYLTELQKHARELAAAPADWMPWNYRQTLASGQSRPAAG